MLLKLTILLSYEHNTFYLVHDCNISYLQPATCYTCSTYNCITYNLQYCYKYISFATISFSIRHIISICSRGRSNQDTFLFSTFLLSICHFYNFLFHCCYCFQFLPFKVHPSHDGTWRYIGQEHLYLSVFLVLINLSFSIDTHTFTSLSLFLSPTFISAVYLVIKYTYQYSSWKLKATSNIILYLQI